MQPPASKQSRDGGWLVGASQEGIYRGGAYQMSVYQEDVYREGVYRGYI